MSDSLLNVVIIAKMNTSLRFISALESIINQEYSPINVVIVDANEQDSDYSLGLQEDISLYPEIEYIKLDSSFPTAGIRNFMLDNLEGEYIAYLTANDTWDIKAALYTIKQFEKNPDIKAICMNGILIDERNMNISEEHLIEKSANDSSNWVLYNPAKMPAQVIYRAKGLKAAGGFDEKFEVLCDADMILRFSKTKEVLIKPEIMCECRMAAGHMDYEWKWFLDLKKFRIKYLDLLLQDKNIYLKFYKQMIKLAKTNYMWLDFIIYNTMYFIKAPFKSLSLIFKKLARTTRHIILWIRRELSIIKDRLGIRYRIRYHKPKKVKHPSSKKREREQVIDLTFLSANHYNEQSPLEYAFNYKIRNIIIPEHVTTIKKGMFYGCKELVFVEIPDTVTKIEAHAFHNCINLHHIKFGENSRLSKIGEYAFAGCSSLEEIKLPLITEIGSYTFAQCYSLKALQFGQSHYFPSGLEKLPRYAFAGCKNLSSVEFETNSLLDNIEDGVFFGCTNLKKIVVTGRVKNVGAYAFAYCSNLETVAILQVDNVESIGKGAFMHCKNLPYFQFPNDIKRIRARSFYGCLKLKSVKIPKKVLSINYQAFGKCPMLSNATILSGDIMISATAFDKHTKIQIKESIDINQYYK